MATIIDVDTELDNVRWAIDSDLTADDLPNAIIASPLYLENAEAWVKRLVTDAESKTGADLIAVKNAVYFYTGALIVPTMRQRLQTTTTMGEDNSLSVRYKDYKWEDRQKELFDKAYAQVQTVVGIDDSPVVPYFFEVHAGGRGAL